MPSPRAGTVAERRRTTTAPSDAATASLCLALALHGKPLPPAWLQALEVDDASVDAAMAAGLVTEQAGGFALSPHVDAAALVAEATWSSRRQLHLALAQACQRPPVRMEDAARHLEAAGCLADAARLWITAADAHCRRHHHKAASTCFASGLRVLPAETTDTEIDDIVGRICQCASLSRQEDRAIEMLADWSGAPPWCERPAVRATIQQALATLFSNVQRHADSGRARLQAARDLASLGRAMEAAAAATAAARTLALALQLRAAAEAGEFARELAEQANDPATQAQAATVLGFTYGTLGRRDDGIAEVRRALDIALNNRLTTLAANAYRLLGNVNEYASCYTDQQAAFSEAIAFCRRYDQSEVAQLCMGCLSYSYFRSGSWKRSETTARKVTGNRASPAFSKAVAETVLGLLYAYRGSTRPATRLLDGSIGEFRTTGVLGMEFFYLLGKVVVEEATGNTEHVSQLLRSLLAFWRETEDRHDAVPGLVHGVLHFAELGQREAVAEFAEALDRIASSTANPEALGAAHLGTAELSLFEGNAGQAVKLQRKAIDAYEQRELCIETIRAQMRLAAGLQMNGETREASMTLTEALRRAKRLGARPLCARIESQREAISATKANGTRSAGPWETLSPRQREVARALARGLTNKEIAAELNLSVRTVDMHVAHIFERLDCRTRSEAAARIAADLG